MTPMTKYVPAGTAGSVPLATRRAGLAASRLKLVVAPAARLGRARVVQEMSAGSSVFSVERK